LSLHSRSSLLRSLTAKRAAVSSPQGHGRPGPSFKMVNWPSRRRMGVWFPIFLNH
jgi:hypothetical protein